MRAGRFFEPSEIETLTTAINAVQDAWGVMLSVSVQRHQFEKFSSAMVIRVQCLDEVHTSELNGFAGTSTWLVSERLVPLQLQMIAAIQQWLLELNQHMAL